MGQRRLYSTRLKEYDTLYDLLETSPEATKTEIRENWLRLSMQYHPDLNKVCSMPLFLMILNSDGLFIPNLATIFFCFFLLI